MTQPAYSYDEASDTLYVSFEPGAQATGIELNEHILLRFDAEKRTVVGLTLFDYSLLAQRTDVGPRSFPLDGLAKLSARLRKLALELLRKPPLSEILNLSAYTPTATDAVPITSLQPLPKAVGQ